MKKLFDSAELGREQKSRTTTEDDLVLPRSFFRLTRTRESTPANAKNSVLAKIHEGVEYFEPKRSQLESLPATKNHQGGLGDSEDESEAKIFSVPFPDPETGQQSAPNIQLELMPRQPQQAKGTTIEFLSKIILTVTTSVTCRSKFSAVVFRQLQCASA